MPYEIHVTEETYHLSQTNKKKNSSVSRRWSRDSMFANRKPEPWPGLRSALGCCPALGSVAARPRISLFLSGLTSASLPRPRQHHFPWASPNVSLRIFPLASRPRLCPPRRVVPLEGSFVCVASGLPGLASDPSPLLPRSCPLFPVFSAVMSNSPTPRHWILPKCSLTNCQDYSLSFFRILFKCHFFS